MRVTRRSNDDGVGYTYDSRERSMVTMEDMEVKAITGGGINDGAS